MADIMATFHNLDRLPDQNKSYKKETMYVFDQSIKQSANGL